MSYPGRPGSRGLTPHVRQKAKSRESDEAILAGITLSSKGPSVRALLVTVRKTGPLRNRNSDQITPGT